MCHRNLSLQATILEYHLDWTQTINNTSKIKSKINKQQDKCRINCCSKILRGKEIEVALIIIQVLNNNSNSSKLIVNTTS